ncbi:MAG: hypothetical protein H0X65_16715 [Gemmatimonadetes bacterium]|nr:hypothetical protein [Gemmatimonadota bacterium]
MSNAPALETPTPATQTLSVLRALFAQLAEEEIAYCHWKSNEHLRAAMVGATDLDLLVERRAALRFTEVLAAHGFKRFAPIPRRAYPAVEDFLGFDYDTGALVHLHVHYELTIGEPYLKGYRLPWEHITLATRRLDAEEGVYTADPHIELLLLLVRSALKAGTEMLSRRAAPAMRGGALRELRWLCERVSPDILTRQARELLGSAAADLLPGMLSPAGPTRAQLHTFRTVITPMLRDCRSHRPVLAFTHRWTRELAAHVRHLRRRLRIPPRGPQLRTVPRGGLLIALLGADGAGKSTLARELDKWLSWKLDVMSMYGGSGAGSASMSRRLLEGVATVARRAHPRRSHENRGEASRAPIHSRRQGRGERIGRIAWALALARERRRRADAARRARNAGMIVVFDRLPQRQFAGLNDGPKLEHWLHARNPAWRAAARYEEATFTTAGRCPPDLVIRLRLSFEEAYRRKPETPADQLLRKLEIVPRLQFTTHSRVIDIDAGQPLQMVLLEVKRAVWESL